jgi:hypothetical protein
MISLSDELKDFFKWYKTRTSRNKGLPVNNIFRRLKITANYKRVTKS